MSRRAVPVPLILTVFTVPLLWLAAVVNQYGIEVSPSGYVTTDEMSVYVLRGAVIGCVGGLMAGCGAHKMVMVQWAFTLTVVVAGLNSWAVMFIVVGINSTSGHGIEDGYVWMTVLSWLLAFAAFFGTAAMVHRAGR